VEVLAMTKYHETWNLTPEQQAELTAIFNGQTAPPPPEPTETPLQEAQRRLRPVVNKLRYSVAVSSDDVSGRYLKSRRIDKFPLPPTVRHWSWQNHHALIGIFANQNDTPTALNVVYLNADATNVRDEYGGKVKRTPAFPSGSKIVLSESRCGILIVCEGLETGLSVWASVPDLVGVWCVGSKGNLIVPIPDYIHTVILARDNDDYKETTDGETEIVANKENAEAYDWAARHYHKRFKVRVPMPETLGHDMNDLLREKGRDAIWELICNAKLYTAKRKEKTDGEG
jgi:hypothetical protein